MKRLMLLLLLVGLVVGSLFLGNAFPSANETRVDLDLVAFQIQSVAVWVLTLAAFFAGVALSLLLATFLWLRGAVLRRQYRKTIKRLESELHQMRSLPLQSEKGTPVSPPAAAPAEAAEAVAAKG